MLSQKNNSCTLCVPMFLFSCLIRLESLSVKTVKNARVTSEKRNGQIYRGKMEGKHLYRCIIVLTKETLKVDDIKIKGMSIFFPPVSYLSFIALLSPFYFSFNLKRLE